MKLSTKLPQKLSSSCPEDTQGFSDNTAIQKLTFLIMTKTRQQDKMMKIKGLRACTLVQPEERQLFMIQGIITELVGVSWVIESVPTGNIKLLYQIPPNFCLS